MISAKELLQTSNRQHLMLLYNDERERSSAEIDSINLALADGCYSVYATVDADDSDFITKLSPLIKDYDKHIKEGNLKIVNFKPYYEFALNANLDLFNQLKEDVEEVLKRRVEEGKKAKALVVADAACHMSKHKQFEECVSLETWWQNTYSQWVASNLDITIICAHPLSVLKDENKSQQSRIANQHSMAVELDKFTLLKRTDGTLTSRDKLGASALPLRILIVEPEPDIRTIYARILKSLPIEVQTVENGMDCFGKALTHGNNPSYDLIIIDTHIRDTSAVHIASKILQENPNQRIVFSTTWNKTNFESELQVQDLNPNDFGILQKPFQFSQLLALIKPAKSQ